MIRLVQRRLIIPRGDTGFFAVPALTTSSTDNIAVFSIIDITTKTLVFQKEVEVSDEIIKIEFSHNDTVNLPVGKYVWDIKFYQNPSYADGELVNGDEIDSYYAGYTLPPCEIRETADKLLVSPKSPSATLTPEQLDIISAAIISLEDAIEKTGANVEHYPTIIDDYWYVWDANAGEYVNTEVSANGIPGPTGNGIENIVFNNDYSLTITLTDGQVVTTRSIRGEVGPPPNLTIGTVTEGATAAATITGTAADPVLNLVLPTADVTAKADKVDTVLETSLSRGRKANTTIANGSIAFGVNVEASGPFSHAEGMSTRATTDEAYAEGISTQANGVASHAEGMGTKANGSYSHTFGTLTTANGMNEVVLGNSNVVNELYPTWVANTSYDIGDKVVHNNGGYECITANTDSSWTFANWKPLQGSTDAVLTIGNGIDNTRSNALKVNWNGDIHSAGDIYVHTNNDSTGGVKVATVNDIPVPTAPATDGVALVSVNGAWTQQDGYGYINNANEYGNVLLEETNLELYDGWGYAYSICTPTTKHISVFINNIEYDYEIDDEISTDYAFKYISNDVAAPASNITFSLGIDGSNYVIDHYIEFHITDSSLGNNITIKIVEKKDACYKINNKYLNAKSGAGYETIVENDTVVTDGVLSHAEGAHTKALAHATHAEGIMSVAWGVAAHAEGVETMASSPGSHSEGISTKAKGNGSHAEGQFTNVEGTAAHVEGYYTTSKSNYSHVSGKYNVEDNCDAWPEWTANTTYHIGDKVKQTSYGRITPYICKVENTDTRFTYSHWTVVYEREYAEIVGNGTADNARSNARALGWDGNEYLMGDLFLHCAANSTNGVSVSSKLTALESAVGDVLAPNETDLVASQAYAAGDLLTVGNKLYKATTAIAQGGAISTDGANSNVAPTTVDNEFVRFTDYANADTSGVVKIMAQGAGGLEMTNQGYLCFAGANDIQIKAGTNLNIAPSVGRQHIATFYGLAKAAGDTTQVASSNAVGTYTDDAKKAIKAMLGVEDKTEVAVTQTQTSGYKIATVSVDSTDTDLYIPKIADEFDSTKSYNPGAIVMHNGKTYMLNGIAQSMPGAWNDSKWNECAVGNACEAAIAFIDAVRLQSIYRDIRTKLTAPSVSGTNGQVLVSDGNGNQVWQTLDVGSDITVTPTFNAGQKIATISVDNVDTDLFIPKFVDEFNSTKTYYPGSFVLHDGKTYVYTQREQSSGEWDPDNWVEASLGSIAGTALMAASQIESVFDQIEDQINTKLTAPSTAGTSGQVLTSDGNGGQSWQTLTGGNQVTVTQNQNTGHNIATISVDGTSTNLYAPQIADDFDSTKTYSLGSIVFYNGKTYLYSSQQASSGAWDSSKWQERTIGTVAAGAVALYTSTQTALAALDSIKLNAPTTAGTNGQILTINNSGTPVWATPAAGGVTDVQVNGTSVVSGSVANIPAASNNSAGVVKIMDNAAGGLGMTAQGYLCFSGANESQIKTGTTPNLAPPVSRQHMAVFYGLAKAAGDTTQISSSNAVGTYTDAAKTAIQTMLGIDMPTKTSDLTNDSYFVSASFNGDELVLATAATWAEGVSF